MSRTVLRRTWEIAYWPEANGSDGQFGVFGEKPWGVAVSDSDDHDRELAELMAKVDRLTAAQAGKPPKIEVTGGPSSGGGFRGGFFGCMGVVAAVVALIVGVVAKGQCSRQVAGTSATSTPASNSVTGAAAHTPPPDGP